MNKAEGIILSYDLGTSGLKTALIGYDGSIYGSAGRSYELHVPKVNYAEQDPEDYWNAICITTRDLLRKTGITGSEIKGISMSTQGMGLIPTGEDGEILYSNITWVDNRGGKEAKIINERLGEDFATATTVVSKILWLKNNEPEVYEKTKYFLDCTGFIVNRLTGNFCMELTNSSPYSLDDGELDFKRRLYEAAGIDIGKMPPLTICTEKAGEVNERAAGALGLEAGTPVFMGSGDVPATAAGTGCSKPGDAHVSLSSSGWFSVLTDADRYPSLSPGIYQIYSVNKDIRLYGGGVQCVGSLMEWAAKQFYFREFQELGTEVFKLMEREASQVPPGSDGLIATPWLCGESCPVSDENAKAVFLNITNRHDRRHFIRALMEGVAYSLKWQSEYYTLDSGGGVVEEISAIGGAAENDLFVQIVADVMEMPVARPVGARLAGAIGGAVIAGVGLGLFTFEESSKMIHTEKTFVPDSTNYGTYRKQYGQFKEIYPRVKPIYDILNKD